MNDKLLWTILSWMLFLSCGVNAPALENLQVEYETTPLGIDVERPCFSWLMRAEEGKRGCRQTAYRITVTDERGEPVWDTGRVLSDKSLGIEYAGRPLNPASRYTWKAEVWNEEDKLLTASSWFETGLMSGSDAWEDARWIGGGDEDMVLYSDYLPVFRLDCRLQLDEKSGSTLVGFLYGGNDPRLMDADKNLFGLAAEAGHSYIKVELDISPLARSSAAMLHVYRVGYCPTDKADVPLKSFSIPGELLNGTNCYDTHVLRIASNLGYTQFGLDGADAAIGELNLNPLGQGGDFIAFPVVGDVGLYLPAGQSVTNAEVCIRNFRSPANPLATVRFDCLQAKSDAPLCLLLSPEEKATPMLRTEFETYDKKIAKARLYVTARGIYDVYLNGHRIGEDYFNPGVTEYNKTHLYQTYDVTSYLHSDDDNALGAVLAEGWWSGGATYVGENWNFFGDRQSLLAKLVITYEDGSRQSVVTHPDTWRYWNNGPVRYGSLFQGEVYDARREKEVEGWSRAGYDDTRWKPASEVSLEGHISKEGNPNMPWVDDYSAYSLIGQIGQTVKEVERLTARSVQEVRPGVFVYDMGQNMVGVPLIRFPKMVPGTEVRIRYAEVTYPDLPEYAGQVGMVMMENIRAAMAQDIYIARGGGKEIFSPRFTCHGYRYLELTGIEQALPVEDVQGVVLSSIHEWTSDYETSNEKVNRLWKNIRWSARANFLSIPTDCPQRNERLGWCGDISVFSRTGTSMAALPRFMSRFVRSIRDVQRSDGRFADIAPLGGGFGGILWGSAGITVPWECYRQYGDRTLLEEHYNAMKRYIDFIVNATIDPATNLIVQDRAWGDLGDWLGLEDGRNDKSLFWEAYFIYDLQIMQKVASILGREEDACKYAGMCEARKAFFRKTYLQSATSKTMCSGFVPDRQERLVDTQTSYVLPLAFGIVEDSVSRKLLADNLAETIRRENHTDNGVLCPPYSLMTGFIGTSWIGPALSENGYSDLAYRLLQQTSYPSWLYPVEQGATTIWERLNSYTHTDGFGGNNRMNSFNHYSFGAIGAWMCEYSLGIRPDESAPAFKRFILAPEADPTGQMHFARGYHDTMYGRIESSWEIGANSVCYRFTVPANTTALLILPASAYDNVYEGGKSVLQPIQGITLKHEGNGWVQMELQAGRYDFEVRSK